MPEPPPQSGMGSMHIDASYRGTQLLPAWRNSVYRSIHLWLLCCTSWRSDYRVTLTPQPPPTIDYRGASLPPAIWVSSIHSDFHSHDSETHSYSRHGFRFVMGFSLFCCIFAFAFHCSRSTKLSRISGAVCFNFWLFLELGCPIPLPDGDKVEVS